MVYAGFWKRFAAYLIDMVLLLGASAILDRALDLSGLDGRSGMRDALDLLGLLSFWLYFALLESGPRQATLGKMALGIKVTGLDGQPIGFGTATGRYFGKFVSGLLLTVGYWMAGFTARKQALHDMMAGCLVVNRTAPPARIGDVEGPVRSGGAVAAIVALSALAILGLIGGLIAVAVPYYEQYVTTARLMVAQVAASPAKEAVSRFRLREGEWPAGLDDVGLPASLSLGVSTATLDLEEEGALRVSFPGAGGPLGDASLLLVPEVDDDESIDWVCHAQGVDEELIPVGCVSDEAPPRLPLDEPLETPLGEVQSI